MSVRTATATPAWQTGLRPITVAILAMGGEGGGVLSDWIADVARNQGWIAQTTSVAGVAQRTGATVYYVELMPPETPDELDDTELGDQPRHARRYPVLSTMPTPGEVDVVIASELMEAGRAVQRGFVTPDRTTLIASTNRVYSIDEKSGPADSRVDGTQLLAGAEAAAQRLVAADFMEIAVTVRSVISASLFGAVAGAGVLPFEREMFEEAIRAGGKGVEQSLAAFAAGYEVAQTPYVRTPPEGESGTAAAGPAAPRTKVAVSIGARPRTAEEKRAEADAVPDRIARTEPRKLVGPTLGRLAERVGASIPPSAKLMALRGLARVAVYQDEKYADLYLRRVQRFVAFEADPENAELTREIARHTALWMTYQDTIHVAHQKVREGRIRGVREEARAADEIPVEIREFLHPQVEELTDTMPPWLGRPLRRSTVFGKAVDVVAGKGIVVNSISVPGFLTLSTLARLRPLRPRTLRFEHEQAEIETWLDSVFGYARTDYDLAVEVAKAPRVLKGYGETWERGEAHFADVMQVAAEAAGSPDAAQRVARAMADALR